MFFMHYKSFSLSVKYIYICLSFYALFIHAVERLRIVEIFLNIHVVSLIIKFPF